MYVILYSYYDRNPKNREPIGQPIWGTVSGDTLPELNRNYQELRDNHDVFKYTQINFASIREEK